MDGKEFIEKVLSTPIDKDYDHVGKDGLRYVVTHTKWGFFILSVRANGTPVCNINFDKMRSTGNTISLYFLGTSTGVIYKDGLGVELFIPQ